MGKSNKDKPKKYYAVKKGKKPGIYIKWDECKAQIFKYPGAIYKSFKTLSEAKQFMENKSNIEIIKSNNEKIKSIKEKNNFNDEKYKFSEKKNKKSEAYAYIDGSFNIYKKIYGYGSFIKYKDKSYIIQGKGNESELIEMRNVAGEIIASRKTIEKAIELNIKSIDIYYDYEGIKKWATGEWKTNKDETKKYHDFFQDIKSSIEVNFIKVKGHSGNEGNDEADRLAKEACDNL